MALRETLTQFVVNRLIERPAIQAGIAGLVKSLESHQATIEHHVTSKADSPRHRAVFSHIIGIERWGQNRLKVALGAPYILDEYNNYRPAKSDVREELLTAFRATRAETIQVAHQIQATGKAETRIPHNAYGDLTALGWLRYLDLHATMETKKIW